MTAKIEDAVTIALSDALHDFMAAGDQDPHNEWSSGSVSELRSRANEELVETLRRFIRAEVRAMLAEV